MPLPIIVGSESAATSALLAASLRAVRKDELDALLEHARGLKPHGYDSHHRQLHNSYAGRGETYLRAELVRRYGGTGHEMPLICMNLPKLVADVTSGAYDGTRRRVAAGANGRDLAPSAPAQRDLATRIARDRISPTLAEIDQRLRISYTQVSRLRGGHAGTTTAMYWPHAIQVIPDPADPTNPDRLLFIAAEGAGPDGATWHELWARPDPDDPTGWMVQSVGAKGDVLLGRTAPVEWGDAPFPWLWRTAGFPDGATPFVDEGRDLLRVLTEINVALCDAVWLQATQGHTPLVLKSNGTTKRAAAAWGANKVMYLDTDEALAALQMSPKLNEGRALVDQLLRMLAVTQGMPEDAYSHQRDYQSGDSRREKHGNQTRQRRQQQEEAEAWETMRYWPAYMATEAACDPPRPASYDGVNVYLGDPPPRISLAEQVQSAAGLAALGMTPARAAVRAGVFDDLPAAIGDGLSDDMPSTPQPPPPDEDPQP